MASEPVSLCRGVVLMDSVIVHSHAPNEEMEDPSLAGDYSSLMKTKQSFDSSGNFTRATSLDSSFGSSFGDNDSLAGSLNPADYFQGSTGLDVSGMSDQDLLVGIEKAAEEDKMVLVAHFLREMEKRNLPMADPKRRETLAHHAQLIEEVIAEHQMTPEAGGWKKQGVMHGKHADTAVYHRVNENQEMTVRLEAPMEASLLIPLLSVLNETDLWTTWMPSFQRPFKLGMRQTEKLKQCSRASQIARARMDMPWPLNNREIIASNIAAEAVDEMGAIIIRARSLEAGEHDGCIVPPVEPGWDRIDMNAGCMIRKCPEDHIALKKRQKWVDKRRNKDKEEEEEPLLLFSMIVGVRPSINVITRAVGGPVFAALLSVADEVRVGKRPLHMEAIEAKPALYGWMTEIIQKLSDSA